jgi:hypothetical protein
MKRPITKKLEAKITNKLGAKMTATSARINSSKAKKVTGTSKVTIAKTASSGIKHQVIIPQSSTVVASSSSTISSAIQSSSPMHLQNYGNVEVNASDIAQPLSSDSPTTMETTSRSGKVSKRHGVWYLGGNHVVRLLTSVDGDLDHAVLSKLAAVPTVIGELALSVESLVSDDITVGGFENDLLAKITSNTLTAKRGIMAAAAASAAANNLTAYAIPQPLLAGGAQNTYSVQPAPQVAGSMANETGSSHSAQVGEGQVPNPLLANYQPVPNPLAIRITPPVSPHTNALEQQATTVANTREEMPMIQAR